MPKKYSLALAIIVILVFLILLYAPGRYNQKEDVMNQSCPVLPTKSSDYALLNADTTIKKVHHQPKKFDFTQIANLSTKQLEEHYSLYQGYVKKRNEIAEKLASVDLSNQNRTYSPYRSLKLAETYALNGSLLHELYFENMNNNGSTVGKNMLNLIELSFKSFDAFKKDLTAAALCSRGWAVTCYSLDDHLIHNYVLEEHNQTVPLLAIPLIVLDVYEHAYMIDFGINRAQYLDIFFKQIDWNIVEKRIAQWILPIRKP